jgi:hypothetical protein
MPSALTFTSLQVDVRSYIERGFTAASDPLVFAQIPRLITLAERRLSRELDILGFQNAAVGAMATGVSTYAKPDRWRTTKSINYGTGAGSNTRNPLHPRSYEYCTSYWPDRTVTGVPRFYADYDADHWLIVPTPAADYPFEVMYEQQLPFLDDANQTNWATENIPELLLYATLLETAPYLKEDERIVTWQGVYDRAMQATNGQDIQKIIDRSVERRTA